MTFQQIKTVIILATLLVWGRLTVHLVQLISLQVASSIAIDRATHLDKKTSSLAENWVPQVPCQDRLPNQ